MVPPGPCLPRPRAPVVTPQATLQDLWPRPPWATRPPAPAVPPGPPSRAPHPPSCSQGYIVKVMDRSQAVNLYLLSVTLTKNTRVMIRPYLHGFTIAFNVSEPSTWTPYVNSMHHFLQAYDDNIQEEKNIECPAGQYFVQDGAESEERKACQFKRSQLQNCSGIGDPTFGYSTGQPCILLKMNRIVGYRAGYGTPVSVNCAIQKGNESALKSVDFYPGNGTFDLMYYPYYGKLTHVNYTSPLVALHFTDVKKNDFVPIQCRLNGEGIVNDVANDRFLGRITFTLSIRM
uniref:Sodium/potassium-transporting ATPase subunit beta n=1 Tax=Chelydra serpentina TaxID=8475 RepID=A0A8C3XQ02_CHESE